MENDNIVNYEQNQAQDKNSEQSPQKRHKYNGWSTRAEKLVRYWQEECRLYAWIYEQNVTYYSRLNRTLGIASISLSAITGTTLFNQSASDPDATNSNILIGLGISSIASTILSGLKELLDLNSLITQNTNAARVNSSIVMDIDEQLNMDRADRLDGREFLKSIKDRKNSLIQNGPIIPSRQWKQVHRKIQSKEQLGFLNREVFNEYLEQSVDINKLQFGVGVGNSGPNNSSGVVDYGTPSSNSDGSAGYGSVAIDMPTDNQTLHKRAGLPEKMAFYGGNRIHVVPTAPIASINPAPDDLKTLENDMENLQPRCAARKAILENQYELERLLSKTGELKNKDRQQITSLRDKARTYRETYQKLANDAFADHSSIINMDCARVARLVKAYRDGNLSEPELFRIMQLDLMEIDTETFKYESRVQDLITKTRVKLEMQTDMLAEQSMQQTVAKTEIRYPFRSNPSETMANTSTSAAIATSTYMSFDQDDAIRSKLNELLSIQQIIKSDIDAIIHELQEISNRIESSKDNPELLEILTVQSSRIYEKQNELQGEYEVITRQIAELERAVVANVNSSISYARLQTVPNIAEKRTVTHMPATNPITDLPRQPTSISQQIETPSARQQARPSSTVPSDDEFIENLMGDNLCGKQLHDMIKPISLPNSPTSAAGSDSTSKSPKRRGSKYDAQMRYQTARIT
jgi:hypothetical protein